MSSWTLAARCAEKPPEKGIVAIDLTIDGGDPITLRFLDAQQLEAALSNTLTGAVDDECPTELYAQA